MLYGDPTEVISNGGDIVELINEEEDPRGLYGVRKHSIVPNPTVEGLRSRGIHRLFFLHLLKKNSFTASKCSTVYILCLFL